MEALTGASIAALTLHDMCKALDPGKIVYTFAAGKRRDKVLKDDRATAQYFAASRDFHADLVRRNPDLTQPEIARRAMKIAGEICVYTNGNVIMESMDAE